MLCLYSLARFYVSVFSPSAFDFLLVLLHSIFFFLAILAEPAYIAYRLLFQMNLIDSVESRLLSVVYLMYKGSILFQLHDG